MAHLAPDAAKRFGWRSETPPMLRMDPTIEGWTRDPLDPNVVELRNSLAQGSGLRGLDIVDGTKVAAGDQAEVERAVKLFLRDGFCAMKDALSPSQLETMRVGVDRNVADMLSRDPHGEGRGTPPNNQPGRYSFGSGRHLHEPEVRGPPPFRPLTCYTSEAPFCTVGSCSASSASGASIDRHIVVLSAQWCMLVDLPTTTPILKAIFSSDDYTCWGAGGDFCIPGAIEYELQYKWPNRF